MSPASTFLFLVFPLFFFFFLIESNADECSYSYPCKKNGIFKDIKYPFWSLEDTSSTVCGYPGLGIDCSNPDPYFPLLYHSGDAFLVKEINYENHSITLVDTYANTLNKGCPRAGHNFTLAQKSPLVYDSRDMNLTFYFNCTEGDNLPDDLHRIECLKPEKKASYLYVGATHWANWFRICEAKVETIVMQTEGRDIEWLVENLDKGFVLKWVPDLEEDCGHCPSKEKSNVTEKSKVALKIGIGFGGVAFGAIVIGSCFFVYNKRHKKRSVSSSYLMSQSAPSYPSSSTNTDLEKSAHYHGVPLFDYNELEEATDNFDPKNELGDGGFGTVYKGKLRDGRVVAVKRLYENNYKRVEQFMNEIEILARKRHKNLVTLYGCTSRHSRELLLVYEYISNGTIADHLHGGHARPGSLTWTTRLSIAIETASALAYLHASDVIHRDVKTNNILLDDNFCVKVADFGLSRLFPIHATHVSTAPQGTPGYVDPEYHECYQLTSKSDVYSFGVVLIELISSLPAVDITRHRHEINLSNMAINKIQCNALHELVDKNLGFESDANVREMISAVAELAFQCLQSGKDSRPTMQQVLESLVEIQNMDSSTGKRDSKGSPTDSSFLLKNNNNEPTLSPSSVINAQWPSRSTTNSSSSY